ncbi:MAG: DNA polymerase III subunit epsilon [Firmicutes bacterium HGW-Firmicutes-1]|jgi:DNA polymerase-3 subunit alpha (Gram-positive type)|nr:MAG: DNA polymerase III subunit epsilon [Firmicutes bacterium HGW-Firmicutes-1]
MDHCIVFDIETTGFQPETNKITEIGAIKIENGKPVEFFSQLINPEVKIPKEIIELTGISDELVIEMPTIHEVLPKFIEFCEGYDIMGHNIMFDFSFIKANALQQRLRFDKAGIDTLLIARALLSRLEKRSLEFLCNHYGIVRINEHRAYDDAVATYELFLRMKEEFYSDESKDLFLPRPLHWKPQKVEPITLKQERFLEQLVHKNKIKLAKPINEYTKSEASRQIDLIINQYGNLSAI